jgi:DNA-binding NarL/FixJ family response regulator
MALEVLLFDESEAARTGLARLLERRPALHVNAAVGTHEQAEDAVAHARPDLVLLDLHTQSDGVDLCRRLRSLSSAPLVVLASFMPAERWSELKAAGASAFLLKHVDSAALERDLLRMGGRSETASLQREEEGR